MRSTLFIFSILFFLSANAQIKKGATLLGGDIGFNTESRKPDISPYTNTSIFITPSFSKAIKQNLTAGFDLTYAYQKNIINDSSNFKRNVYGIGLLMRKYKYLGSNFYLFGEGRLGSFYTTGYAKNYYYGPPFSTTKTTGYGLQLAFNPGISYSINNYLQLETRFNNFFYASFNHEKAINPVSPNSNSYTYNSFVIGSSFNNLSNFVVGLRVLINR